MKRKRLFPYPLGWFARLDVRGDDIIIEERGMFRWWRWVETWALNTKTNEIRALNKSPML